MNVRSDRRSALSSSRAARLTETIASLRQQVARYPADLNLGLRLGSALHTAGDYTGSATVLRQVVRRHPASTQAGLLLARAEARAGRIAEALAALEQVQQSDPDNQQSWQVAAGLATQVRDWPALGRIGTGWTSAHPSSAEAWKVLSQSHFEQSRFREARDSFAPVLELESQIATNYVSAAQLAMAAEQYDAARAHLATAEALAPESGKVLFALTRLHHLTGEVAEAENYCRCAIHAKPRYAPAYAELGELREGELDEAEIDIIEDLIRNPEVPAVYHAMLGFTLGEALDRRGEYASAFAAWEQANRINQMISEREGIVYDAEQHEAEPELLETLFSQTSVADSSAVMPTDDRRPIFVVGMPRSGTTLVESILASHSKVYGAGELTVLPAIHEELMELVRTGGVSAARGALHTKAALWRERYLAALPSGASARYVVDKQPLNYRSVGLIRILFPRSPIIYTRRSPMDAGLSIFRHNFSKNWPCAHRLADIGHYYGVHERIITHWQQRYPDAMHIVDHTALVADPEHEIRSIMKFARLDIEPACLTPHKTKRPIGTFSSVQVRRPVSEAYSGRSACYSRQLSPLRNALRSAGIWAYAGTHLAAVREVNDGGE